MLLLTCRQGGIHVFQGQVSAGVTDAEKNNRSELPAPVHHWPDTALAPVHFRAECKELAQQCLMDPKPNLRHYFSKNYLA